MDSLDRAIEILRSQRANPDLLPRDVVAIRTKGLSARQMAALATDFAVFRDACLKEVTKRAQQRPPDNVVSLRPRKGPTQ